MTKAKSKFKDNNEKETLTLEEQHEQTIKNILKLRDFMPKWRKEEQCFSEVVVRDAHTRKIVEGGWPRLKPVSQIAFENWLEKVVIVETGVLS